MRRALLALLIFILGSATTMAAVSGSPARKPVCGPYGDLPREGSPIVSRDGRVLAWSRWHWPDVWAEWSAVFVSHADGSRVRRVFLPPSSRVQNGDVPSALAPDGSEILVSRSGDPGAWILASTSRARARVISAVEARQLRRRWRTPEWSPDGEYRIEEEWQGVYVVSADGQSRRLLAALPLPSGAAWSPDGALIAIGTESLGLYVVRPDGTGLHAFGDKTAPAQSPVWSPDGALIAFDQWADGAGSSVAVIRADGSGYRKLAGPHEGPDVREAGGISWVGAKRLVFDSHQFFHDGPRKVYDIHTIGVDGRNERRVTYQCHLGSRDDDVLRGSILGDTMRTYAGDDDVRPGPGADDVDAGAGNDVVRARDGARDAIRCGSGRDRVLADQRDFVRGCERITRR